MIPIWQMQQATGRCNFFVLTVCYKKIVFESEPIGGLNKLSIVYLRPPVGPSEPFNHKFAVGA